ncbi:pentapeptide repeat-containing protein [Lentzea sp. BCCO 10_0856]|uniref:Pentapeptide repeat-containing protein n=1 Tax=Lentzea miocenica TaxID=3095431 RepID=A0ABU4T823_9PSEU|nr:pentapeptide repeat-containing protein [Lentzea sp. BCCO 10_0856]MDX8034320.1 pentapeptide repeat-containing protein [Lentzea sp. BCCO 10_0856]
MKAKKPMSPWTMPLVSAAILLLTGAVLVALWLWVSKQSWTDPEKRTAAQLDVVKVASGIALGGGGLFTLYLATRRQRTQEEAQADTNADNGARRITELYSKAVQQLGDAKAPVRLGGLYALERLGQQEEETRRTIIKVLCAYLRMPYTPPSDRTIKTGGVRRPLLRNSRIRTSIQAPRGPGASAALVEARLELDVRLTAQRILADRLGPGEDCWGVHHIDLSGAVLVDFDVNGFRFASARFDQATFLGNARLSAEYAGLASFNRTSFTGSVSFAEAAFEHDAHFAGAAFGGRTWFADASFAGSAVFAGVSFLEVDFSRASFSGTTSFAAATFDGESFADRAGFEDAQVLVNPGTMNSEWPEGWEISFLGEDHAVRSGEWTHLTQDL